MQNRLGKKGAKERKKLTKEAKESPDGKNVAAAAKDLIHLSKSIWAGLGQNVADVLN